MNTLKELLKKSSLEICSIEKKIKERQRLLNIKDKSIEYRILIKAQIKYSSKYLRRLQRDYRKYHIAYCELRGRNREQIEVTTTAKAVNESIISAIKSAYNSDFEKKA